MVISHTLNLNQPTRLIGSNYWLYRFFRRQKSLAKKHFLRYNQAGGSYNDLTAAAVTAFQKWAGLGRDGVAGPETQKALVRAGSPHPMGRGDANRLELWRNRQLLAVVQNNRIRRVITISSGRAGYTTPLGRFRVFSKVRDEWSRKYHAPMPYASYFSGGIAMHESDDVPGYAASHGCVRVPASWIVDVWNTATIHKQVLVLAK